MRWFLAASIVLFACSRERALSVEITKVSGTPIEDPTPQTPPQKIESALGAPTSAGSTSVVIVPSSVPRATGVVASVMRVRHQHCAPFDRTFVKVRFGENGKVEDVYVDAKEPARRCLEEAYAHTLPIAPCVSCGTAAFVISIEAK